MIYPSGRAVDYGYSAGAGAAGLDDRISRLSFLADDNAGQPGAHLEDESYLGLGRVVKRGHPEPGVDLSYLASDGPGDGGDPYKGPDRFGRVVDQDWQIRAAPTTYTDRFQYGCDRDSNRLYRNNLKNTNFGELYHANGASGYDGLNQLTAFARGVLSASVQNGPLDTIASPTHSQSWSLDATGNWSAVTTDGTPQTRTHNAQNEITGVAGQTTPAYDNNGNMITDQSGQQYAFDAWNRLVRVMSATDPHPTLVSYAFDALGRRIQKNPAAGPTRDLYFSSMWQVIEERAPSLTLGTVQQVWSPVHVDALVLRDRFNTGTGLLAERLYVQQDANWNVTAVIDAPRGVSPSGCPWSGTCTTRTAAPRSSTPTAGRCAERRRPTAAASTPGSTSTRAGASTPPAPCTTSGTAITHRRSGAGSSSTQPAIPPATRICIVSLRATRSHIPTPRGYKCLPARAQRS